VADLVQADAEGFENAGRDAFTFADQTEEQVLRSDVVMAQAAASSMASSMTRLRAASAPPHDDRPITPADDELDRGPDLGQLDVQVLEHAGRHSVALPHEAKEQVLRPDIVVVEPLRSS